MIATSQNGPSGPDKAVLMSVGSGGSPTVENLRHWHLANPASISDIHLLVPFLDLLDLDFGEECRAVKPAVAVLATELLHLLRPRTMDCWREDVAALRVAWLVLVLVLLVGEPAEAVEMCLVALAERAAQAAAAEAAAVEAAAP